jgi:uncharacterized protein YjbJ (UPF0337 family)
MNTPEIKGDWNITKGKLKLRWAKLKDENLQFIEGKHDEPPGWTRKLQQQAPLAPLGSRTDRSAAQPPTPA